MIGPLHDFYLLSQDEYEFANVYESFHEITTTHNVERIPDGILRYMQDTLKWIPTNHSRDLRPLNGLALFSTTIIKLEGAYVAQKVFSAWKSLIECGPSEIILTGEFTISHLEYESIHIERDYLVERLGKLENFATKVINSNGRSYILHNGI